MGPSTSNLNIRRRIHSTFMKLPFGFGSRLIIPCLKLGLSALRNYRPLLHFMHRRVAAIESRNIRAAIQDGANQAIIIYDNMVSPPTYGDYLYAVILARYFIAYGIRVSFYIVDSEFQESWQVLSTQEQYEEYAAEQIRVARSLLDSNTATIQRISWQDCQAKLLNRSPDSVIPFYVSVQNRVSIYNHCFNLLNQLLSEADERLRDQVLFSYQELAPKVELKPVTGPYITWHCRHSQWGTDRNTEEKDFLKIHAYLRRRFPHHSVMIVSDTVGCAHYAKLAKRHYLNCLFSKDYSQTFLGDGALILGSSFFFVVRGGGIGLIPTFSKIPYEITLPMAIAVHNETVWSKVKLTSWQSDQQLWVNNFVNTFVE